MPLSTFTPKQLQQVHQYLYYVVGQTVWTDWQYDEYCKEHGLEGGGGSDCAEHYAPEIREAAKALLRDGGART